MEISQDAIQLYFWAFVLGFSLYLVLRMIRVFMGKW